MDERGRSLFEDDKLTILRYYPIILLNVTAIFHLMFVAVV